MDATQQQQQSLPSSRERIETSMGVLMAHMQRDKASSQLLDALGGQACFGNPSRSGLSETDYLKLPLGQILREENRTPLPPELVQHFQRMRCQFQTGVFAEIQRAWAAVDSDLVIWNYRNGKDVVYYDGIENVILAVDLVRPKPNIFRSHVHYLLAVATPSEVAILGVTLAENTITNDIEMHFVNEPLYSYPLENLVVTKIKGARNGRIFLGGQDGSLYEFSYFAQRGWLQSLCKLTNCSARFPLLTNLLPTLFRGSDPVTEICIDNGRQILYTLSDKGIISVYDLGPEGQEIIYVASAGEDTLLKGVADCVPTQIRRVIHLESLPVDEAGPVQLVAFTQSGARIFLTTCEPSARSGRPCLLMTLHVRMPLALPHKITRISNGLSLEAASLMIDQQNENRHFLIAVDHFAHFRRANQFVETYSFMVVDRNIWSISPTDTPGRRKRQGGHYSRFVMVSLAGCQIISMMTPTEQLRHLLSESRGALHDDPIKTFFAYYNCLEGCVMCLQLICEGDIDNQVLRWANEAFNYYGGEPQLDATLQMPTAGGFRQPFPHVHPQDAAGGMNIPLGQQQQQQAQHQQQQGYPGAGGPYGTPAGGQQQQHPQHPQQQQQQQPAHAMSTPFRPPPYMNTQFIPVSPIGPVPPAAGSWMQYPGSHAYQGEMPRQGQPSMQPPQQFHPSGAQFPGQMIENNNLPGGAPGLTTSFQSLNQAFAHSFKHDSIFVYFSRILRPIFDSQLAKEAPPHAGVRPRLSLVLTSAALTPILQQLQGFKEFLQEFCNAPGGANMYIRSQVLPSSDAMQWKRKAILEEQNSVNNLLVLVTHTMEVLHLWRVVADHDIEPISLNMKPDLFNYLKAITVREFVLCDKQLLSALATSVVDSYLRDGATTAAVSGKLKEFCPSIYGNEDALYTQAFEMLTRANEITNDREREVSLKQALELCRKVSVQALNLSMVCRILDSSRYYEGLLNICLWAAHNVDPHNLANDYYEHGEPQDDDRGRRAFIARKEAYFLVTEMLDGLYRKVRPQDQPDTGENNQANQQKYDEMLTRCIESQDPLLHMCVFDWLIGTDQREKLINLRSRGLERYLKHRAEREPTSINTLELLARHHEVNKKLESAVQMWLQLAHWQGEMALELRTTYLARASLCAQSGATSDLQQQVNDTLEVARIQEEIARHLPANERDAINMRLYSLNDLYTQFAEKYDLAECQLRLLMCAEYSDLNLIAFLWGKLIDMAAAKNDLAGALRKALPVFKDGRNFFPIEKIIAHSEVKARTTQYEPLWLANILVEACGKDWLSLERLYFNLYDNPELRGIKESLLVAYSKIIYKLAEGSDQLPRHDLRTIINAIINRIDRCIVDTQTHITDNNMRLINADFRRCRAVLERAAENYGNPIN